MNELIDSFSNRLKKALEIQEMKPTELAEKTGIDKSKISSYMSGRYKAKQDGVYLIAKVLNVSEAWLMGYNVPMNKTIENTVKIQPKPIPVLGKISAGLPLYAEEHLEGYMYAPETIIKNGNEYFYLKVSGDSMNTKFNDGDLVLIQKQNTLEDGEIGAIRVNGFDATIKRFKRQGNLVILEPMSTNPVHTVQIYNPKEIEICIIGKAIWKSGKI